MMVEQKQYTAWPRMRGVFVITSKPEGARGYSGVAVRSLARMLHVTPKLPNTSLQVISSGIFSGQSDLLQVVDGFSR